MEEWKKNISGRGNQGAKVLRQSLLSVFRAKPRVAGAEGAEGELSEMKWRGVQGERLEKRGALMAILIILTFTRVVWKPLENPEGGATGPDLCFNKTSLAAVF